MFERYTEKARRVVFFARYEASQFGGQYIDSSHLLLGLLREDRPLLAGLVRRDELFENAAVLLGLEESAEKVSTSVDIPLSHEAKRVLAYAAEEAERLGHSYIGTSHLLLGLLREPGPVRELLEKEGLQLQAVREASIDKPRPPNNQQIVADLRGQFAKMMGRMTSQLEPAVVYSPRAEKTR
jgi:ATP-dependent Clp protease ATP-binding subunit ClpC